MMNHANNTAIKIQRAVKTINQSRLKVMVPVLRIEDLMMVTNLKRTSENLINHRLTDALKAVNVLRLTATAILSLMIKI